MKEIFFLTYVSKLVPYIINLIHYNLILMKKNIPSTIQVMESPEWLQLMVCIFRKALFLFLQKCVINLLFVLCESFTQSYCCRIFVAVLLFVTKSSLVHEFQFLHADDLSVLIDFQSH